LEVKAEVKQNSNPNDGPWYGLNDTVVFKSKNLYIPGYGWGPIRRSEMSELKKSQLKSMLPFCALDHFSDLALPLPLLRTFPNKRT